ncbi:GspE/PulE family protein [Aeromicrobium sp. 179-A 4D2 NHS]|uniref:GspE/PulE family protein n=1 Tax=Aeromicrobium sp. 179-A 4D2 NHS TaxID=3142375 RepID=UPI0039A24B38
MSDSYDPLDDIFDDSAKPKRRNRGAGPDFFRDPGPEPEKITNFMQVDPHVEALPSIESLDSTDDEDFGSFEPVADTLDEPVVAPEPEPVVGAIDVSRLNDELGDFELPSVEADTDDDEFFDIINAPLDNEVLGMLESSTARQLNVIPLRIEGNRVYIAAENINDIMLLSRLRPSFFGKSIKLVPARGREISRRIDDVYSAKAEADRVAAEADVEESYAEVQSGQDLGVVGRQSSPAERILSLIVEQAIRDGASDIHIEPTASLLVVRNRVDGKLRVAGTYPMDMEQGLTTLVKVQARMRTDNRFMPDSGVISYRPKGASKAVDIRVETAPSRWGQTVVMRLQNEIWRDLSTLGFSERNEAKFREAIADPFGVVLLVGPTGSGKTTTLYSSLRERIDSDTKIVTLENPIEFAIEQGVTQIAVNEEQGMTFARGLRSIVRQDPDIILIGEIRDQETADVAIDGAMTGHLVFSTLHANDAVGAVPRMTRLGIEPFLLSSALTAVVAQRLVRRLCQQCKVEATHDFGDGAGAVPIFEANPDGCDDCFRGYSGRVPIHEVFRLNNTLRDLVATDPPMSELVEAAIENGLVTMREDGFEKVREGITSVREVVANTRI